MPLSWGGRLSAETMKTLRYSARNAVLIVYYAEPKILDFTDGLNSVTGVVAVPDIPGEADEWVGGKSSRGSASHPLQTSVRLAWGRYDNAEAAASALSFLG